MEKPIIDFIKRKTTKEYEKGFIDGLEFAKNLIEKMNKENEKLLNDYFNEKFKYI